MSERTVAIVGGGIGGLVLALALRERGIAFEVYEQADEVREIGAAVALSANGTRELRRLGLGEEVEAVSVVPSALVIRRWDSGEVVADHPIGRDGATRPPSGPPTTACTASRSCTRSPTGWGTTTCTSATAVSASTSTPRAWSCGSPTDRAPRRTWSSAPTACTR